ncbi:hypothetical protein BD779DRAFT_212565 [Infundibulicybe gibba]|nr:hypothetical protein BD779DRAFT_212565 [Infundibulicybe gibba]
MSTSPQSANILPLSFRASPSSAFRTRIIGRLRQMRSLQWTGSFLPRCRLLYLLDLSMWPSDIELTWMVPWKGPGSTWGIFTFSMSMTPYTAIRYLCLVPTIAVHFQHPVYGQTTTPLYHLGKYTLGLYFLGIYLAPNPTTPQMWQVALQKWKRWVPLRVFNDQDDRQARRSIWDSYFGEHEPFQNALASRVP